VHATTVQGLHGALGGSGVVEFNKAIIKALLIELKRIRLFIVSVKSLAQARGSNVGQKRSSLAATSDMPGEHPREQLGKGATYVGAVLVRDNLDALDVASRLEDLAQHVLGDTRI
jgi:hypothetical protein